MTAGWELKKSLFNFSVLRAGVRPPSCSFPVINNVSSCRRLRDLTKGRVAAFSSQDPEPDEEDEEEKKKKKAEKDAKKEDKKKDDKKDKK